MKGKPVSSSIRPKVDDYAGAIARIVTEPGLRNALGLAGNAKAAAYEWPRVNQAVLDAYLDLMARKAGG